MGLAPTVMGEPVKPMAVLNRVTVPEPLLATYAVVPLGVMAMPSGLVPTVMDELAVLVAVLIGVTVPEL